MKYNTNSTLKALPAICFASVSIFSCNRTNSASQPDIILILADDLGYGDVSCFNENSGIKTPNIDRLAAEGVIFTDAHATSSLSTPSRYSVLTGRYPWRTTLKEGVLGGYSRSLIDEGRSTIADVLSSQGYETSCIGKWHLGWDWARTDNGEVDLSSPIHNGPVSHGFDSFFGIAASLDMAPFIFVENDRATETETKQLPKQKGLHLMHGGLAGASFEPEDCLPILTAKAVQSIRGWKGDDCPHFLYVPLTAPHTPCLPSSKFKGVTGLGDYADFVVMMDDAVGQIVDAVKKNGSLHNTIFVFASDNGCAPYADVADLESNGHFPSYIFRGYKNDIFEGGQRIPLIVAGDPVVSRRQKGSRVDDIVTLADLYATFQDISGCEDEARAEDSFSLLPLLTDGKDTHSYIVSVSGKGWFSIRNRQYKLIFTPGSGGWSYPNRPEDCAGLPDRQLYDILNDPGETHNLIDDPALLPVVSDLTVKLASAISEGRTSPGQPSRNDTEDNWKQVLPIFSEHAR